MKYLKEYLIPSCVIIISILSIVFFRTIPSSKLWKDYSVVYVQKDVDEAFVESVFNNVGCENVISGSGQFVPIELSAETPEVSMTLAKLDSSNYLVRRNSYFYDKHANYKVYYVPDEFSNKIDDAIYYFQSEGINCGVDASSSYPFFIPILLTIFVIFLFVKSSKKVLFACSCLLPVFYSFFIPFYSSVAAVCLLILGFYFMFYTWGRKDVISVWLKNPIILIFLTSSLLISCFSGIKNFLVFVIMLCGTVCIIHFYRIVSSVYQNRFSFVPVKIRSASLVSIINPVSKLSSLICGIVIALILIFSFFAKGIGSSSKNSEHKILLPASYGNGSLPNLNDYIEWKWTSMIEPYVHVSNVEKKYNPKFGDSVSFSKYVETDDGISETVHTIVYSSDFENSALAFIDKLSYPALEKLMKCQKKNFSAGYVFSGSQNVTIFTIIQLVIAMFIPIFVYLYCSKLDLRNKTNIIESFREA